MGIAVVRLIHGIDIVPVVTVGKITVRAVIAFGHTTVGVAVVQAEGMAYFLTLDPLNIGAGIIVVGIVLGMGMFDSAPAPFIPPVELIIDDRREPCPTGGA